MATQMPTSTYDGMTAIRTRKLSQAQRVETYLRKQNVSYKTKIITVRENRKRIPEFVILLPSVTT